MDAEFWHERWNNNQIGFHQSDFNALMVAYFGALGLNPGARVFVPLCGKSRDIGWLLSQGYEVIANELSSRAIDQLFAELGVAPKVEDVGPLKHYTADGLIVFVGDIFEVTAGHLGRIDAVYDRAALVALPPDMRARYAAHLADITCTAPQFLLTFEYDQSVMEGPPFSVDQIEVTRVYGAHYGLSRLARAEVGDGGLKGVCPAVEVAWHLR
jgi:thiopurine S-methyltransferase